jgi:protein phosphatase
LKCPSCGLENGADETYCEDCGALLTATPVVLEQRVRRDPLAPDTVVGERYRVVSAAVDGVFNVYKAVRLEDDQPCRLVEDAEAPGLDSADEEGAEPGDDASRAAVVWRALNGLANPHLWAVETWLRHEGRGFVVGAALPDWTLEAWLADAERLEPDEVRALGLALLDGLVSLHQRGYLHLGIHPSHIYIDDEGLAVLCGYERLARIDALPEVYSVIEGYSAPEAYGIGGTPGPASDVYGVGVTLYHVVSRYVPSAVSREQFFFFPPLSARAREVPPGLEAVIMKALSKDVKARWQSAAEMHEALENASLEPGKPGAVQAPVRQAEEAAKELPERVAVAVGGGEGPSSAPPPGDGDGASGGVATGPLSSPPAPPPVRKEALGFMPVRVGMRSHVGCVRSVNQDSLLVMGFSAWEHSIATEALMVVVADGMGGEAEGDKASSLAIRAMATYLLQNHIPVLTGKETTRLRPENPVERLEELVREAMETSNRVVFEYSQQDAARRGMGSTLTVLMLDWPHAVFGHAGDTRAYLLRRGGGDVDQVTEDHSLVGKLVRLGQLTREEARVSPQRSYLYRALGTQNELEMDVYSRTLEPGDRLLICSDGVWEYYSEDEVLEFLSEGEDPQATCDRLIDETLRRGADDNATAVILHVAAAR